MARNKPGVLKTLVARAEMRRSPLSGYYYLGHVSRRGVDVPFCERTLHRALGVTICPPGKAATVRITIEVLEIK